MSQLRRFRTFIFGQRMLARDLTVIADADGPKLEARVSRSGSGFATLPEILRRRDGAGTGPGRCGTAGSELQDGPGEQDH